VLPQSGNLEIIPRKIPTVPVCQFRVLVQHRCCLLTGAAGVSIFPIGGMLRCIRCVITIAMATHSFPRSSRAQETARENRRTVWSITAVVAGCLCVAITRWRSCRSTVSSPVVVDQTGLFELGSDAKKKVNETMGPASGTDSTNRLGCDPIRLRSASQRRLANFAGFCFFWLQWEASAEMTQSNYFFFVVSCFRPASPP